MQPAQYDNPGILVYCFVKDLSNTPGVGKFAIFDEHLATFQKRCMMGTVTVKR